MQRHFPQVFQKPLIEQSILRPHNIEALFSNLDDITKVSEVPPSFSSLTANLTDGCLSAVFSW